MQLFGREVSLLYIFTLPYLPFLCFWALILLPLIFFWLLTDILTNGYMLFFPTFRLIGDFMFPHIKVCPSGQNGGGRKK
jgi:hypothetical protein